MDVEPRNIAGVWRSYPLLLSARQATFVTVKTTGSLEVVNLTREGCLWLRLDGKEAAIREPDNFVVFLSRRFTTNASTRKVCLISEDDMWATVEGVPY